MNPGVVLLIVCGIAAALAAIARAPGVAGFLAVAAAFAGVVSTFTATITAVSP